MVHGRGEVDGVGVVVVVADVVVLPPAGVGAALGDWRGAKPPARETEVRRFWPFYSTSSVIDSSTVLILDYF